MSSPTESSEQPQVPKEETTQAAGNLPNTEGATILSDALSRVDERAKDGEHRGALEKLANLHEIRTPRFLLEQPVIPSRSDRSREIS